jgi:hypothetical protein
MQLSSEIETVNQISKKDFYNNFFIEQKPLIIKSISSNADAFKKWNFEYLKKNAGDIEVDLYDSELKNFSTTSITKPDKKILFLNYLDQLEKNGNSKYRIFLFNLFKLKPELRKDFPCPEIFKGLLDNIGFMFFGGKNTNVRLHYDIDNCNVLHTHFSGRKKVTLFAPEYSELLYRLPFTTHSLINAEKPDYDKYSALKYVKGLEFILDHGDTLFMPSGYWHQMKYIDAGFSVSYRKLPINLIDTFNGFYNISINMPIDKTMTYLFPKRWPNFKINESIQNADNVIKNSAIKYLTDLNYLKSNQVN